MTESCENGNGPRVIIKPQEFIGYQINYRLLKGFVP